LNKPIQLQGSLRHYEPIPFKTLKELKEACTTYGATAPFTQQPSTSIAAGSALPPDDWMAIAKAIIYYAKLAILKYVKNKPPTVLLMAYELLQICS
jgi:hypothetical protein